MLKQVHDPYSRAARNASNYDGKPATDDNDVRAGCDRASDRPERPL